MQKANSHPSVLFLPGTLCDERVFSKQHEALSRHGYTCKTVTFTEQSTVRQMAETIAQAIKEPCYLCAFSMGAMAAYEFARCYPASVKGLILIGANAHADIAGRAEMRTKHLLFAQNEGIDALVEREYLPNYFASRNAAHDALILDMAKSLGINVFENQIEILASRPEAYTTLKHLTCPVLIIAGEDDRLCPIAEQEKIHAVVAQSELHILKSCGHFAQIEQPQRVNEVIIDWLHRREEHASKTEN